MPSTIIPLLTEFEKQQLSERQELPERYLGLSDAEMDARIAAARQTLGARLVILGHHYQRDEVIKFADFTGDSFRLARQIANRPEAEFIVFCGVHFMAESADVLSAEHQQVILPDLAAGLGRIKRADQLLVGFAMETEDGVARAREKLRRKGCDLIVLNDISDPAQGFDSDDNAVVLVGATDEIRVARAPKPPTPHHG